jgi:hypothetical protein
MCGFVRVPTAIGTAHRAPRTRPVSPADLHGVTLRRRPLAEPQALTVRSRQGKHDPPRSGNHSVRGCLVPISPLPSRFLDTRPEVSHKITRPEMSQK